MKAIIVVLMISSIGFSQNLNSYKYASVPSKFSFQTTKGEFNLNNLTRMILEKNNFETFLDDEKLSDQFVNDNCNKVYADLEVKNTMFVTKVKIILKDCKNYVLFTSEEGKSTEKNQTQAYSEALRQASQSLDRLLHIFKPTEKNLGQIGEPAPKNNGKPLVLVSKKTQNGFDLVSQNSETIFMNLKTTSVPDLYIATRQGYQGILFKSDNNWFFEYYFNQQKNTELINVIF